MTRANQSALVLDGNTVKLRLIADRTASKTPVHVDWFRFTVRRRNLPAPSAEILFPCETAGNVWDEKTRTERLQRDIQELQDGGAAGEALELGQRVVQCLGAGFALGGEVLKGHDFYARRISIELNDTEVGWVGFGASSDSPRQRAQRLTIHCNLYGAACTFAEHGWRDKLADLVDEVEGVVTRADLALDFFDGLPGGMQGVWDQYQAGAMNVHGCKPKSNTLGRWAEGCERSFYFGSKEAGKQTNVYEKGDQLFGTDSQNPWIRAELRYGNKLRVIPTDILRKPADYFSGASDWHEATLALADVVVTPEPIKTTSRLACETVNAEAARVVRHAFHTQAPTMAVLFKHAGERFLDFVCGTKVPKRLQKFSESQIAEGIGAALGMFSAAGGPATPATA